MSVTDISSQEIRSELYFSAHNDGLCLYTPEGCYRLSVAAAEDLMVNFQINLESYQGMVNRNGATDKP